MSNTTLAPAPVAPIIEANNIINLPTVATAPPPEAPRPKFWTEGEGEAEVITDGRFKCLVTKGRYRITPIRDASAKQVVMLGGYRPKSQGEDLANPSDARAVAKAGNRYRQNFQNLKRADAQRAALIIEDANTEKRMQLIQTFLTKAEVQNAEDAKVLMAAIPAPDWTSEKWDYKLMAEYIIKHFEPCQNPKPLTEAVAEFIAAEKEANLKFATWESKASHLNRLISKCNSGIMVHQVPLNVLKALIHSGKKRKSWKKNKSNFNTFFEWAAHEDRGYCPSNPVKLIVLKKKKG